MHVDSEGWLVNDPGDVGTVVKKPRVAGKYKADYGDFKTKSGKPIIFVHHSTGTYTSFGKDSADSDGTVGMAGRVASGQRQYYAHVYLSRDGVAYQMVPFTKAAPHVPGTFKFNVPPEGKGKESNKISVGMEWVGWGGTPELAAGWPKPTDPEKLAKWQATRDRYAKEWPSREDFKKIGSFFWQTPTIKQSQAAGEVLKATVAWSGMDPEAAFYGHKQLNPNHGDPGGIINAVLDVMIRPMLGLTPKAVTALFPFPAAVATAAKAVVKAVTPAAKAVAKAAVKEAAAQVEIAKGTGRWIQEHPVTAGVIFLTTAAGLFLLLRRPKTRQIQTYGECWPNGDCNF